MNHYVTKWTLMEPTFIVNRRWRSYQISTNLMKTSTLVLDGQAYNNSVLITKCPYTVHNCLSVPSAVISYSMSSVALSALFVIHRFFAVTKSLDDVTSSMAFLFLLTTSVVSMTTSSSSSIISSSSASSVKHNVTHSSLVHTAAPMQTSATFELIPILLPLSHPFLPFSLSSPLSIPAPSPVLEAGVCGCYPGKIFEKFYIAAREF